ncbi:hypothetical protein [Escherichia coli]|uniref:hypothetical protein n=1 Tax=Escherichia coli TaxID=562 RepID=UPI00157A4A3C|nr:hypothetical protein [Escherichia coli]
MSNRRHDQLAHGHHAPGWRRNVDRGGMVTSNHAGRRDFEAGTAQRLRSANITIGDACNLAHIKPGTAPGERGSVKPQV